MFKYLYYRIYSWNHKKWGENDLPQWNALFGVSFMMFLNICFLCEILQFSGIIIFLQNETPKKEIAFIMLGLFVVNYFLFIHKNKYISITKNFMKESPEKRKSNTIILWLYIALSFTMFVLGALFIGYHNIK